MPVIQDIQFCSPGYLSLEEAIDVVGKSLFEDWSGEELGWLTRELFKTFNKCMFAEDCANEGLGWQAGNEGRGWQTREPFSDKTFNECMRLAEALKRLVFLVHWSGVKAAVLDTNAATCTR